MKVFFVTTLGLTRFNPELRVSEHNHMMKKARIMYASQNVENLMAGYKISWPVKQRSRDDMEVYYLCKRLLLLTDSKDQHYTQDVGYHHC